MCFGPNSDCCMVHFSYAGNTYYECREDGNFFICTENNTSCSLFSISKCVSYMHLAKQDIGEKISRLLKVEKV